MGHYMRDDSSCFLSLSVGGRANLHLAITDRAPHRSADVREHGAVDVRVHGRNHGWYHGWNHGWNPGWNHGWNHGSRHPMCPPGREASNLQLCTSTRLFVHVAELMLLC